MNLRKITVLKPILVLVIAALCGCAHTQESRVYVLTPLENQPVPTFPEGMLDKITVSLSPISIPKYLDRPQIITQKTETELAYSEFYRWGAPLSYSLTEVILLNIGSLVPEASVFSDRMSQQLDADYQLQIEILRMTGKLGEAAELVTRWSIYRREDDKLLDLSVSRHSETLKDSEYGTYVEAMSQLVAEVAREIAGSLQKIIAAKGN